MADYSSYTHLRRDATGEATSMDYMADYARNRRDKAEPPKAGPEPYSQYMPMVVSSPPTVVSSPPTVVSSPPTVVSSLYSGASGEGGYSGELYSV